MLLPPSLTQPEAPISDLLTTTSLYLHIPFCHTRCHYCDFNTYAGMLPLREPYVRALLKEIQLAGEQTPPTHAHTRTIFFGGGTPSLLSVEQITRLLNACFSSFQVDPEAEITLEANPGTLTEDQLVGLRAAGINRLSMGAQSFDAQLLLTLGRIHTPEEIRQAVHFARKAGFESINIDLMFGLPGQTMQHWQDSLEEALALGTDHLSLYSLIVEPETPFFTWVEKGELIPGDPDLCADMYEYADELLAKRGYVNYEISNWAKPDKQSRHNLTYWQNLPYLGFGAGAHSFFQQERFSNERNPTTYIQTLKRDQLPIVEREKISRAAEMSETAFLGLRTAMGIHLPTFEQRFQQSFSSFAGDRLQLVDAAGLLDHEDEWLRLSQRGRLLGNEVFLRLLPDEKEEEEKGKI